MRGRGVRIISTLGPSSPAQPGLQDPEYYNRGTREFTASHQRKISSVFGPFKRMLGAYNTSIIGHIRQRDRPLWTAGCSYCRWRPSVNRSCLWVYRWLRRIPLGIRQAPSTLCVGCYPDTAGGITRDQTSHSGSWHIRQKRAIGCKPRHFTR